ncbi:MAG: o-succinylbenzoate synthase [Candidatus Kryptonium sp.]|nr:o-succinylbenzoate synthase [Candidatus Kryptonium sp.]
MKEKIEEINLYHVRIPMTEPFKISNGEVSIKDSIIIQVKFKSGLISYGEASPMSGSFYSEETPESVWNELINKVSLIKTEFDFANFKNEISNLLRRLSQLKLSSYAIAGIETALWDAYSKILGKPIYNLLGANYKEIESGLAVGIYNNVNDLLKKIEGYLKTGNYKRVKIKIQKNWDIEPISNIRKFFGNIPLMVDANCAYDRNDIEHLKKLDDFELMMIEQPLPKDDLIGHGVLQTRISTPICLDESADSIQNLKIAFSFNSCKIVNIKIQRVGGLLNAKRMHDFCKENNIPVWVGTMPELGIGAFHALSLCMLDNCKFPTDIESSLRWYIDDIIEPVVEVKNGKVIFNQNTFVNLEKIQKYSLNKVKIKFN